MPYLPSTSPLTRPLLSSGAMLFGLRELAVTGRCSARFWPAPEAPGDQHQHRDGDGAEQRDAHPALDADALHGARLDQVAQPGRRLLDRRPLGKELIGSRLVEDQRVAGRRQDLAGGLDLAGRLGDQRAAREVGQRFPGRIGVGEHGRRIGRGIVSSHRGGDEQANRFAVENHRRDGAARVPEVVGDRRPLQGRAMVSGDHGLLLRASGAHLALDAFEQEAVACAPPDRGARVLLGGRSGRHDRLNLPKFSLRGAYRSHRGGRPMFARIAQAPRRPGPPEARRLTATGVSLLRPGVQLGELDQVPAGVVQHGDRRADRLRGRHGERHAESLQLLVLLA